MQAKRYGRAIGDTAERRSEWGPGAVSTSPTWLFFPAGEYGMIFPYRRPVQFRPPHSHPGKRCFRKHSRSTAEGSRFESCLALHPYHWCGAPSFLFSFFAPTSSSARKGGAPCEGSSGEIPVGQILRSRADGSSPASSAGGHRFEPCLRNQHPKWMPPVCIWNVVCTRPGAPRCCAGRMPPEGAAI